MKCEEYRLLMMDAIYDEITRDDLKILKNHLKQCSECRTKFAALKATTQTLAQWPDVEPGVNLTFVTQPASRIGELLKQLKSYKTPYRLGLALATALVLLALINTRIHIGQDQFDFESSLLGQKSSQTANLVTKTDLDNLRQENYQLVAAILEEYSRRNKIETAVMLDAFYNEIERKRQNDLRLVGDAMAQVQYGTTRRIDQTDRALGTLIKYVNLQNQEQRDELREGN
jgi:predicted anti-sigma-YlaC factor YlaD